MSILLSRIVPDALMYVYIFVVTTPFPIKSLIAHGGISNSIAKMIGMIRYPMVGLDQKALL
jgi:hypothetical protein